MAKPVFWTVQQHDTQTDRTDLDCVGWNEIFLDIEEAKEAIEKERDETREGNTAEGEHGETQATPLVWTDTEGRLLAQDEETPWTVWTIVPATIR